MHTILEKEKERKMSSHDHRFRLSHLMPNSWFYKLRDMKRPKPASQRKTTIVAAARSSTRSSSSSHHYYHGTTTPKPPPLAPPIQPYYSYVPQAKEMPLERHLHFSPLHLTPSIQSPNGDRHHHSPPPRRSGATVAVDDGEFQDVQLRPIRTRPASSTYSLDESSSRSVLRGTIVTTGTCPSSPRMRSRRLHVLGGGPAIGGGGGHRRSSARRTFAVVKASADPARDFWESMVEMVVENEVRAPEELLDLLECYLSLNSREHHGVIMEVFRGIWLQITDADDYAEM